MTWAKSKFMVITTFSKKCQFFDSFNVLNRFAIFIKVLSHNYDPKPNVWVIIWLWKYFDKLKNDFWLTIPPQTVLYIFTILFKKILFVFLQLSSYRFTYPYPNHFAVSPNEHEVVRSSCEAHVVDGLADSAPALAYCCVPSPDSAVFLCS